MSEVERPEPWIPAALSPTISDRPKPLHSDPISITPPSQRYVAQRQADLHQKTSGSSTDAAETTTIQLESYHPAREAKQMRRGAGIYPPCSTVLKVSLLPNLGSRPTRFGIA